MTSRWPLLLTLAAANINPGCAWITKGEVDARADRDGDGFAAAQFGGEDCDDGDQTVHPDASETCDGRDEDCDGRVDNVEAASSRIWYADRDGDGAGDSAEPTLSCTQPTDTADNADDCDDSDAAINPDAPEICNGVDDDCDARVDQDDDSLSELPTWYFDADGDGFGTDEPTLVQCEAPATYVDNDLDCDDDNERVYPGASEHCDGLDEDCDGELDEDAVDTTSWYSDDDDDGWGQDDDAISACDAPSGRVGKAGDCDDGDDAVYPGAPELCSERDMNCDGVPGAADDDGDGVRGCEGDCDDTNANVSPDETEVCNGGVDDDCDGLADDDDESLSTDGLDRYFPDADADGYGDDRVSGEPACVPPAGWVLDSADCDDGDSDVNPDAYEVCGAAADEDCDGSTTDCEVSLRGVTLRFDGVSSGDLAGVAVLSGLDLDGDGADDLVVGAPGLNSAEGAAYVITDLLSASSDLADAPVWKGSTAGDEAGSALAAAGDLEGDGYDDVAVSSPVAEQVYLLSGPASSGGGLTGADVVLEGPGDSSGFGAGLWLGDLDGDGAQDAAVGAPLVPGSFAGLPLTAAGEAFVFFGPSTADRDADDADASLFDADEDGGHLGRALTGADGDGDGVNELIISALDTDSLRADIPVVYLFDVSGGGSFDDGDADRSFSGSAGTAAGEALAAGLDVDGDGKQDLLIGGAGDSRAYLLLGPLNTAPTSLSSADARFSGSDDFGVSVALLPDVDGDGCDEVAVGGDNAVRLWLGSASLSGAKSTSSANLSVSGDASGDEAGAALSVGDIDADHAFDLMISAPGVRSEAGAVYGLLGAPF